MLKKYIGLALLAAKNIFVRGSAFDRVRRILMTFGFPLYIVHRAAQEDFEESVRMEYQPSISEFIFPYLIPLLILLAVSWLWQLFLCVGFKNGEKLKMNAEEKVFTRISLLVLACLFIFVNGFFNLQSSGFGAVFRTMVGIASFGITILGIFLTIKARDRIPVFLDMMLATSCVAVTFIIICAPLLTFIFLDGMRTK